MLVMVTNVGKNAIRRSIAKLDMSGTITTVSRTCGLRNGAGVALRQLGYEWRPEIGTTDEMDTSMTDNLYSAILVIEISYFPAHE